MNIIIREINKFEINKLEKMMQLYLHDLSISFPLDFNSEICEYKYDIISYFQYNKAYFICADKDILGFILVDINSDNMFEISEMFVLNNYKGKGIGGIAAKKIFDLYKGKWTIKVLPNSIGAEKFWKKTVKKYTNNKYEIVHTGKYNRAEFYFDNY